MGKQITIPPGLNVNDVDVGTLSPTIVEGVFVAEDISMNIIAALLGILGSNFQLKSLSLATNIAIWAAFKPNDGSRPSGINLTGSVPKNFIYSKPNDLTGYRLGDFAGYNHTPPIPGLVFTTESIDFSSSNSVVLIPTVVRFPEVDMREYFETTSNEGVGVIVEVWVGSGYATLNATYYKRLGYSVVFDNPGYSETPDLYNILDILKYPHTLNVFPSFIRGSLTTNTPYKIKVFIGKLTLNTGNGTYYVVDKTNFPTNALSVCEYTGTAYYLTSPMVSWEIAEIEPFTPFSPVYFYNIYDEIIIANASYPVTTGNKTVEMSIYYFIFNSIVWDREAIENETNSVWINFKVWNASVVKIYDNTFEVPLPTGSYSSYILHKIGVNAFTLSTMPRNFDDGDIVKAYISLSDPDIKK